MNSKITNNLCDVSIPLFGMKVTCGFPSPADDYIDHDLDLNRYLIKHPSATFLVRAKGESMSGVGICDGDLLIVDRSLSPLHNSIVIASIYDEFTVKRLKIFNHKIFLYAANKNYKHIEVTNIADLQIWGVVTHAIHDIRAS